MQITEFTPEILELLFDQFIRARTFQRAMRLRLVNRLFRDFTSEAIFRSRVLDKALKGYYPRSHEQDLFPHWGRFLQTYLFRRCYSNSLTITSKSQLQHIGEDIHCAANQVEEDLRSCVYRLCGMFFYNHFRRFESVLPKSLLMSSEPMDDAYFWRARLDAAVFLNYAPLVERLLKEEINGNSTFTTTEQDFFRRLEYATHNGSMRVIRLLIDERIASGQKFPERWKICQRLLINQNGKLPGDPEIFEFAINLTPDADWRSPRMGFHMAIYRVTRTTAYPDIYDKCLQMLGLDDPGFLFENLWENERSYRDLENRLTWCLADSAASGRHAMMRYCLGRGVWVDNPLNTRNYPGYRSARFESYQPVLCAVQSGQYESIKLLLQAGADLNCGLPKLTCLMAAVLRGNISIIHLLVEHGADVNDGYCPPIVIATILEDIRVFRYLRENGAVLDTEDSGSTAMAFAQEFGLNSMVEVLETEGIQKMERLSWLALCELKRPFLQLGGWLKENLDCFD